MKNTELRAEVILYPNFTIIVLVSTYNQQGDAPLGETEELDFQVKVPQFKFNENNSVLLYITIPYERS